MPIIFLITDDAGLICSVSPAARLAFGYAPGELDGRATNTILEIADRPEAFSPVWIQASPNPIVNGVHRDGKHFPLRLNQHEFQSGGRIYYALFLQDPAEPALTSSEGLRHRELYELATTHGRISVWEVDYRTNFFEISPVMGEILGLTKEQMPTSVDGWRQRFHPDDWQLIERESARMLAREIPEINVEGRMYHADGHAVWALVRGKAFFDDAGQPIRAIGTTIDIGDRKKTAQLAAVEHAVARVLAASPNLADASTLILQAICEALDIEVGAVWQVDKGGEVLRCVQTWHKRAADSEAVNTFEANSREMTFTPGVGLPGRVWADRQPAWVPDVVHDNNFPRAPFAAGANLHVALAFPILLNESVLGVIEFFSSGIRAPDRELLQMMGAIGSQIGQFVERKRAEEALRDQFFDLSLDMLCIADTAGYFRSVNPAFTRVLGFERSELLARPFVEFIHPDDVKATQEVVADMQSGKDVVLFENRYRCKDGSYRWLSWKCPAPRPGSDLLYAVARDVTDSRRVQADLHRAKQEAEQANRAKSEFLSRMSHELRTPLNAILGFGQLLQREPLNARQLKQIDLIVQGGRHLLTLINEVLDITRIEVGKLDLSPESIDVGDLVQEVVGLTQPMAKQADVRVSMEKKTMRDRFVLADKQRLKQVLLNLVANAIKYNGAQGKVTVRCALVPPKRVQIQVEDTGLGIALEKQARMFTPFDRLGAEATSIEGSGLGLVLSRRLTEVMGGTLTFVSTVGEGTTFTVELPQAKNPKNQLDELSNLSGAAESTPGPESTVLYIEDNTTNVQLVQAVLAYRPGIRLITTMQGSLGLEMARQQRPDLILLDVHLPDTTGGELMTIFHSEPGLCDIPVIVISADATPSQIERLLAAGARDYLTKPIDVDQLLRAVDRWLAGGSSESLQ